MKLSWSSASQAKQVIPQARLFPPNEPALSYTYDAVGNRLSESGVDFAGAPINRSYSYDPLNRLQQVSGDAAGNIAFQYDNNGNLLSQTQGAQTTRYEYDTRDQMRRVLSGASGNTEIAAFDYDFSRRRLSKTASGSTTSFVYDGSQIINEYGATGALVNRYDYGADLLRGELGGEGERFYFSDALGSTTALSSSSGGVSSRFEYDAWGVMSASSSVSTNQIGYTGQRLDTETGLMALGNGERYYAPQFGQFIQQDSFTGSLTTPQSMNRHSYVHNNPLAFSDPTGHEAKKQYAKDGYFRKQLDELKASPDEEDWYVNFAKEYYGRTLRQQYDFVNMASGDFIHREDRLYNNYKMGNLTLGQLYVGYRVCKGSEGLSLIKRGAARLASPNEPAKAANRQRWSIRNSVCHCIIQLFEKGATPHRSLSYCAAFRLVRSAFVDLELFRKRNLEAPRKSQTPRDKMSAT